MKTRIVLVRHGRAAAGWDTALDPSLDELGRSQAESVCKSLVKLFGRDHFEIVTSPLQRCQQTADVLAKITGRSATIISQVAEIPSPVGVALGARVDWLRGAMLGTWAELGSDYVRYRDGVVDFVKAIKCDTVIFSHFIAINAVIGKIGGDDRVVIRKLDNCSLTHLQLDSDGLLQIVEHGHEADTLIR